MLIWRHRHESIGFAEVVGQRKRLRARRSRRGVSLLDTTLAVALLSILVTQIVQFSADIARREAAIKDGRYLTELVEAGRSLVIGQSQSFLVGSVTELSPSDLATAGLLQEGRTGFGGLGRDYSVSVLRRSSDEFVILGRGILRAGEPVTYSWPTAGEGIGLVGTVHSQSPEFLRGPSLNYDLTWMVGDYASARPRVGDVAVLDTVRVDQAMTPYLHRVATPISPELNRMDADLDLNGNDVLGASLISAAELEVTSDIVTQSIAGTTRFNGTIEANALSVSGLASFASDLNVTGAITSDSATVTSTLEAATLQANRASITGGLVMGDGTVSGTLTIADLAAETLTAEDLEAEDVISRHLNADLLTARQLLSSTNGEFETITTGNCTGC